MKKKHDFQIIIEQDEAGYFVAECPALKACYAQHKKLRTDIESENDVVPV